MWDSCGGGIHGGDIVGGTRGSTVGVAAGWDFSVGEEVEDCGTDNAVW